MQTTMAQTVVRTTDNGDGSWSVEMSGGHTYRFTGDERTAVAKAKAATDPHAFAAMFGRHIVGHGFASRKVSR